MRSGRANIFTAVVLVLGGLAIATVVTATMAQRSATWRDDVRAVERSAQAAQAQIVRYVDERRNFLTAFAQNNRYLLDGVLDAPRDETVQKHFEAVLRQYHADFFAYTVYGANGVISPDPLGGLVGDVCIRDINQYGEHGAASMETPKPYAPYIHPQPLNYHFDIMALWDDERHGGRGVFFLSFFPDRIAEILAAAQPPGAQLFLIRTDDPTLIEIGAVGGRDKLSRDIHFSDTDLEQIVARLAVPGTGWTLVGQIDPAAFDRAHRLTFGYAGALIGGILLLAGLAIVVIRRSTGSARSTGR